MEKNTTHATPTETVEAFLKAVKKDSEMYSFPEEYFTQFLVSSLKSLCSLQKEATAYIQLSTRLMQEDQARQGR